MSATRRVTVIGLDGATFNLLDRLRAAGDMPELDRLMRAGCHGELRSTFPPLTPPAWSSFMTGKNPGKHGVVSFRRPPVGYRTGDFISAKSLRARTLWEIVGEAGLRIGAINVVPSYPVQPVNGFMVACMLSPPGAQDIIYPPEFRPLLGDDYVISLEPPKQLVATDPDYRTQALDYLGRLRRLGLRRREVALRLMEKSPCDLLALILYEPDRVQHFFWKHLVGSGPEGGDPAVVAELAETARAIYRDLDETIGAIVRAAGPDATTLIISDHGFGDAPDRFVYVNRWLADRGWLHVHRSWRLRLSMVRRLPDRLRKRLDTVENIFVDWRRTMAWCDAMETRSAGLWLNVKGRQTEGCVEPGAEYERLRDEIRAALADLRDDGRPVFDVVARREDVYQGPVTEQAPDLLLYCKPTHGLRFNGLRPELRARAPFAPFVEYGFTGAHQPSGIYVAAGPSIAPLGRRETKPIEALAPTILALLGLPIPDGMDAPPMIEFLTPEAREATPVRYVADTARAERGDEGAYESEEDREQVEARLRALGYVE